MPLTVWLNNDVIPYLDDEKLTSVYTDLFRSVSGIFKFVPKYIELWKNSTTPYLDGVKVLSKDWDEIGKNYTMQDLISNARDEHHIIVIGGNCDGDPGAKIEIYGKSAERKVYSDFLFEMGGSLYDYLEESDNLYNMLSELHRALDTIKVPFETTIMNSKKKSIRKVVEKAFISDNIPNEDDLEESSMLFIYKPTWDEDMFFRYVVKNVLTELRKEMKSDPFMLFDSGKIAKNISRVSKKKGFTLDKYANILPGSVSYIAKTHENLDTMFDDLKSKVTEPILKRMSENFDPERIMEESVTESAPDSLDKYE